MWRKPTICKKALSIPPYEWVRAIAAIKAEAVGNRVEGEKIIIAADTIVTYMGKILHRPFEREEAASMLRTLSGHKHTVYTGLAVMYKDADGKYETHTSVTATDVYMRELTDMEISNYVDTKEPYDKAGGYGIQGKGSLLIDHIDGDYFNVVGLPLVKLYKELSDNGVKYNGFLEIKKNELLLQSFFFCFVIDFICFIKLGLLFLCKISEI